jgi:2-polyprenyl-3-methyl-5-hydroxy-6-metoxy-1,4-benzoquinol methylase
VSDDSSLSSNLSAAEVLPSSADAMRYDAVRDELVDFVPANVTRLLDVGCAAGRYAAGLAIHRPEIELWGVEPDGVTAEKARPHFHTVVHGAFPDAADQLPQAAFDVVTFNDVLEHLVDPYSAIEAVRPLLSERGMIVASIPNVRHQSVVWPLVRDGRWDYTDIGLLDRTHLRFFTRATMSEMFTDLGWRVESVVGINRKWVLADGGERRRLRAIRRIVGSRLDDFFYIQYVVTARPEKLGT